MFNTPPPRFPIMHWALYGLISLVTLGLYSLWTSFRLTQEVARIETCPVQKKMFWFSWALGIVGLLAFFIIPFYFEDDRYGFLLLLALPGRFGWTFLIRGSLSRYYAQAQQRYFLPNGFLLLFAPIMLMTAKAHAINTAPRATYRSDPMAFYHDTVCIHPALYFLINLLTLTLYGFFMMYVMTWMCRQRTGSEGAQIRHMWYVLVAQVVVFFAYLLVMDLDSDINAFDRIVNIVSVVLTLMWAYTFRQFFINQMADVYDYPVKINRALVLFFPVLSLLCAVRKTQTNYELYQITQKSAAK